MSYLMFGKNSVEINSRNAIPVSTFGPALCGLHIGAEEIRPRRAGSDCALSPRGRARAARVRPRPRAPATCRSCLFTRRRRARARVGSRRSFAADRAHPPSRFTPMPLLLKTDGADLPPPALSACA
ncbi:hypothetical protein EVAR_28279_1 [Eumeta japonica]|uniref:Uncharacterized protein n=1 Tax=Eumeta variegata TaxID=151549 RepID=A0A4C1V9J3_EUMVA|nr:hypothetical protein EVAR_28279_1 [Eumeta japonica]